MMINRLYEHIETGLEKIKPSAIYREFLPPDYTRPAFLINLKEQALSKGINGREKHLVTLDISYYPANTQNSSPETQMLGLELARGLQIKDFKMKKRNWKIEDNILHLLFDVEVRSFLPDDSPYMQSMSQNTNLKEE